MVRSRTKSTKMGSLTGAASTSPSSLCNIAIIVMLMNMGQPGVPMSMVMKMLIACCICSSCSGLFRFLQLLLHGILGIKTF